MLNTKDYIRYFIIIFGLFIAYTGIHGIQQKFSPIASPILQLDSNQKDEFVNMTNLVFARLNSNLKLQIEDHLFNELKDSTYNEKYNLIKFMILLDIAHGRLEEHLIQILKNPSQVDLFPISLNHLATKKNNWLQLNINTYLNHYHELVRLESLKALLNLCPVDGVSTLETYLLDEKNLQLLQFAKKIKSKFRNCKNV